MSDVPPPASTATAPAVSATPLTPPDDLALYAALTGRVPEIDPTLADPLVAATAARRERPWSPVVLSLYLHRVYQAKGIDGLKQLAPPVNRPELTAWVRRGSSVARRTLALPATVRRAG